MSNRCVAGFAVCVTVLGATTCTLAAYSAYRMRTGRIPADLAIAAFASDQQTANRSSKADRLQIQLASADAQAAYALASAAAEPERVTGPAISAEPVIAAAPPVPASAPAPAAETKLASVAPTAPVPHDKPKHLLPPPPPAPKPVAAASGVLDDSQIAGLRGRLRLTSEQAEYWPAVEAALRDVARTQLRTPDRSAHSGRMAIDVNSPEVQKLIWAAVPLLARLREDQKSEVRKIARVIGLEQVASQI